MQSRKVRTKVWLRSLMFMLALLLVLSLAGTAVAATLVSGDEYRLESGQVIEDNLYVAGEEIIIDGTVDGDLIAVGGYIEVNGRVTGDVLAAGGGIVINGAVEGDVRIAGGGLKVNGTIGGDLVAAGGGATAGVPEFTINVADRMIDQGLRVAPSATVGKDALLAGGSGEIGGTINGNLWTGMGRVTLNGTVGGDANLYAGQISVSDNAKVGGTLVYGTDSELQPEIPPGVAATVERVISPEIEEEAPPTLASRIISWIIRVARELLGLIVVGWLLLRLAAAFTRATLETMESRPLPAIGIGIVAVFLALPVALLLVGLAWIFWGFLPGVLAMGLFVFGALGLLWINGPVLTGYWVGRRLVGDTSGALLRLVLGVLVLILVVRALEWVPFVGGFLAWLIVLFSFAYAVGAMLLRWFSPAAPVTPLPATPAEVVPSEPAM